MVSNVELLVRSQGKKLDDLGSGFGSQVANPLFVEQGRIQSRAVVPLGGSIEPINFLPTII